MRIVDEEGAGALSMRTLAQRLGSSTATIYRHFANREALVGAVIDQLMAEVDLTASGTWRDLCRGLVTDVFTAMKRHPNVALLMADQIPEGPNAIAARERWLAVLTGNGFPLPLAVQCGAVTSHYVQGFALQIGAQRTASAFIGDDFDEMAALLDPEDFPVTLAAVRSGALPVPIDEEFAFGLDLIFDAITRLRDGC